MAEELIRFSNVQKHFGSKVIYRGLNLTIRKGEVFTILGGSGVGKSVMLKMLIGLLAVDGGSIQFDGQEVTTMNEQQLSMASTHQLPRCTSATSPRHYKHLTQIR